MEAVIGWGMVLAGVWVAREIARQQAEREAKPEPIPVRADDRRRHPQPKE